MYLMDLWKERIENIKTLFRSSFGSRNFTRMRNRIMYCINQDCSIQYPGKKTTNKYKYPKRGKYKKSHTK